MRLFVRFRIHLYSTLMNIHWEVHEPAFSIHCFRPTSDHQAVPECARAMSQPTPQLLNDLHSIRTWHCELLSWSRLEYRRQSLICAATHTHKTGSVDALFSLQSDDPGLQLRRRETFICTYIIRDWWVTPLMRPSSGALALSVSLFLDLPI